MPHTTTAATPPGTRIENTAQAFYNDGQTTMSNTVAHVVVEGGRPNLSVALTVNTAHPLDSDTVVYTVSVRNTGPFAATGVTVDSMLPEELDLTETRASQGAYAAGTWSVGDLAPGAAATLILTARPGSQSPGRTLTHIAEARAAEQDADPEDNVAAIDIRVGTQSKIELLKYAPAFPDAQPVLVQSSSYSPDCSGGGPFSEIAPPVAAGTGAQLDLDAPLDLVGADLYHQGDPVFVRLTDRDQNLDHSASETVIIRFLVGETNDAETVVLTETGPDTGVFTGHIQTVSGPGAARCDGQLTVVPDAMIEAIYTDEIETSDAAAQSVLVDPFGMVFDSRTGAPVNGARVTLIDAATGQPAQVFGDDGVSTFPATLVSGDPNGVRDSSGTIYRFDAGAFRFPLITPGTYRLEVLPPEGYSAPSSAATADLQRLAGAPFAIVEPGSRGEIFTVNPGPALHIDIPVDPANEDLFLTKTVGRGRAAVGDFLEYVLAVENTTDQPVGNVAITDQLPPGFAYQDGSCRLDNRPAPDPAIAADGRTLTLPVGTLAPNASAKIAYVIEVGAGARAGTAVNRAVARGDGGAASRTVTAAVEIFEDLFRSRSFIAGRVLINGCDNPADAAGLPGVRIYLEDGAYVVTDEQGRYHFEGVAPGTHVVQLDRFSLPEKYEPVACAGNGRFAGRGFSQFVDLQGGTLWRADFYVKEKPKAAGLLELHLRSAYAEDTIFYEAVVSGQTVPVRNLRLTLLLADNLEYVAGSSSLGDAAIADPQNMAGALTWRLEDAEGVCEKAVSFRARILPGTEGEWTTRAIATFNTPDQDNQRTPMVENTARRQVSRSYSEIPDLVVYPHFDTLIAALSDVDRALLEEAAAQLRYRHIRHIFVIGHTDNVPIKPKHRELYPDNIALSLSRAESVGAFLRQHLDLADDQVTLIGKGDTAPIADNHTEAGRAMNRRVELRIQSDEIDEAASVGLVKARDRTGVETVGNYPGEAWERGREAVSAVTFDTYDLAYADRAAPGLKWLWPEEGFGPAIPSVKIAIQHEPLHTLKLFLNGAPVSPLNLDTVLTNRKKTVSITRWRGVDVEDGDNIFELVVTDGNGVEVSRMTRMIHYATAPVRAELVPDASVLVADGKTPPVIAVRLTDKTGYPAREGIIGEFAVAAPHRAKKEIDSRQEQAVTKQTDKLQYRVEEDGIARIELQPTTASGEAEVLFPFATGEQSVTAWLSPEERDWILVGLAEGTVGYNTVSGNMENYDATDGDDKLYEDGRIAFFAKGKIRGKWLLTLAYDSEKGTSTGTGLYGTIDPDTYYTLYGDATIQGYDAPSTRRLYLKIEREQFYALFGDYDTGLTVTELARYSRTFNGVKSEYRGERFAFNVFASESDQVFVKDEIRGDGTSGIYRLSQRPVVINSEKIVIETRDRFRSELILEARPLRRHLDYDIDYDAGTLWFKRPVFSKDGNLNPVFIVADYEVAPAGIEDNYTYGGRGAVRLHGDAVEIGATYVHEDNGTRKGDLGGVDARVAVGLNTEVRAEIAATSMDGGGADVEGNAYLLEVSHISENLAHNLYIREQDGDFGLGQLNGSEQGTRKIGGSGTYRFSRSVSAGAEIYRQYNLSDDNERDVAEVSGEYASGAYNLLSGFRFAEDRMDAGEDRRAAQMIFGGSRTLFDSRLRLHAVHEQTVSDRNANPDFPTRTILGGDFKLTPAVTLFAEQEFTNGDDIDTQATRVGIETAPWTGGRIHSSVTRDLNENAARVYAGLGLAQTWQVNERWALDGGLDHGWTVSDKTVTAFDPDVPPASGSDEDFTAVSLGAGYRRENWFWNGRAEFRDSDASDKWGVLTGVYGDILPGIGMSAGVEWFETDGNDDADTRTADIRFGLAYRPTGSAWIVLDRLDLILEETDGSQGMQKSRRIVNNLNVNWQPFGRWQLGFQYGAKYVKDTIGGTDYSGYTDLIGAETRYNMTDRWDVGLHGSVLHSWNANRVDYRSAVSVGCAFMTNAWASLGYNFTGFADRDFSRSDFTAQGPFIKLRIKVDQETPADLRRWYAQYGF